MKKSFTMFMNNKDYFFITSCKSINSKVLIEKICSFFGAPVNENTTAFLKSRLEVATLEFESNCIVIKTKNGSVVTPYGDDSLKVISFTQKNRSLATKENIEKLYAALKDAKKAYNENPDKYHVHVSNNNQKTGDIKSVSTLPYLFCPGCAKDSCGNCCYAFAMALNGAHPDVVKAWAMNTAIMLLDINKYFEEISTAAAMERYFRYHVSGEILNNKYFELMIKTALENPKTEFLAFTKNYGVVNAWISAHGATADALPENLHIIFSAWKDELKPDNPYNLPETNVLEETENPGDKIVCGGNCFFCACRGVGCWTLKNGQVLYFYLH